MQRIALPFDVRFGMRRPLYRVDTITSGFG
jgi:hypothetical protein